MHSISFCTVVTSDFLKHKVCNVPLLNSVQLLTVPPRIKPRLLSMRCRFFWPGPCIPLQHHACTLWALALQAFLILTKHALSCLSHVVYAGSPASTFFSSPLSSYSNLLKWLFLSLLFNLYLDAMSLQCVVIACPPPLSLSPRAWKPCDAGSEAKNWERENGNLVRTVLSSTQHGDPEHVHVRHSYM